MTLFKMLRFLISYVITFSEIFPVIVSNVVILFPVMVQAGVEHSVQFIIASNASRLSK